MIRCPLSIDVLFCEAGEFRNAKAHIEESPDDKFLFEIRTSRLNWEAMTLAAPLILRRAAPPGGGPLFACIRISIANSTQMSSASAMAAWVVKGVLWLILETCVWTDNRFLATPIRSYSTGPRCSPCALVHLADKHWEDRRPATAPAVWEER
jgi:hypothetical protein